MPETARTVLVHDPYEHVRETVGRVCIYDPATGHMVCDRTPADREAIQSMRNQLLRSGQMTTTQYLNAMEAATVSLDREYQQFAQVTPEDFGD